MKARLDAMDEKEVMRKRHGAKKASKAFAPRPGRLGVGKPLEVVQIDYTLAEIILVDHVDRGPLARPYSKPTSYEIKSFMRRLIVVQACL